MTATKTFADLKVGDWVKVTASMGRVHFFQVAKATAKLFYIHRNAYRRADGKCTAAYSSLLAHPVTDAELAEHLALVQEKRDSYKAERLALEARKSRPQYALAQQIRNFFDDSDPLETMPVEQLETMLGWLNAAKERT